MLKFIIYLIGCVVSWFAVRWCNKAPDIDQMNRKMGLIFSLFSWASAVAFGIVGLLVDAPLPFSLTKKDSWFNKPVGHKENKE